MENKDTLQMENLGKMLFSIQKYMILETKLNNYSKELNDNSEEEAISDSETKSNKNYKEPLISNADAYAWSVGLYPLFGKGTWHDPVKDFFDISEEKVFRVIKYLDDEWMQPTPQYHTFYKILRHFTSEEKDLEIDKWDLICILRYTHLCGDCFDENFWKELLKNDEHPIEAKHITKDFDIKDIRLGG